MKGRLSEGWEQVAVGSLIGHSIGVAIGLCCVVSCVISMLRKDKRITWKLRIIGDRNG